MFEAVPSLPADPILGLGAEIKADPNPEKIDMGVGVYKTEDGHTPVLAAVKAAEHQFLALEDSKAYLPPAGTESFLRAASELVFGASSRHCKTDASLQFKGLEAADPCVLPLS